jgi:MoxR-like ATPase
MAFRDLSDPQAVELAIQEFDELGRDSFLKKHGFGPSRGYLIRFNGKEYDSKAIAGVAHGYQFPELGALSASEFTGGVGARGAARKLRTLGFEVVPLDDVPLTGYWWVNQGQTFSIERAGGYLWAGKLGATGAALDHHMNVSRLRVNDIVVHYADGFVKAVGRVSDTAIDAPRPDEQGEDQDRPGYLARVEYFDLTQQLDRDEIPVRLRRDERGPFNRLGRPKQVYLSPLSEDFIAALQDLFPDRLRGTPLAPADRSEWLFQASPSVYDLDAELPNFGLGAASSWKISRFGDQMAEDDICVLWAGGENAGVRAIGRITGAVFEREESLITDQESETAIPFIYTLLLGQPITKQSLEAHPILKDLTVIRAPRGAAFKVTEDQWVALRELILAAAQAERITEVKQSRHLLFKWDREYEPRTIESHREVAEQHGSVWWGKFGKPGSSSISQKRLKRIRTQLEEGVPTYAFLYRAGEVWQATLEELTISPDDVDTELMPSYYTKEQCVLFARVSNFVPLDAAWPAEHLVLASNPDPDRIAGALGNQTSPLTVLIMEDTEPAAEPLTFGWLEEQTLWPPEALQELLEALTTPPGAQIVLAGPPGTGKTWVAKHLVRYLTQDRPLAYRIVQFHPSYGYEDFIEGLRPIVKDGGIEFTRVDGVVLQLVNEIEEGDDLHFIVIDEMNRANLPRVFGELMYLLEYRGDEESIALQYSPDFSLPHNIRFIGTMNTADRSIRSIDTALRRRFEIFDTPPDAKILERYYEKHANEVPDLISGFVALNERLTEQLDRHHTIGHTFFMKDPMQSRHLRSVWSRQVSPLIEEYFFDQPDIAASFAPSAFWPSVFGSES